MKTNNSLLFACFLMIIGRVVTAELPDAEVTIHVTDSESNKPVPSAEVRISFTVPDKQGGTASRRRTGVTDQNGDFTAEERTLPDITASAVKAAYYPSGVHYDLKLGANQLYENRFATISIVLKRIGRPIAMYARKRIQAELPALNKAVAYDLTAGDWIAPYGRGTVGDLVFLMTREEPEAPAYLNISFSNEGDGIQAILAEPNEGSLLRLPPIAPETGYQTQLRLDLSSSQSHATKTRNYFYRVRTVKENNHIQSAMYGKIHGEIDVDTVNSRTGIVLFTYYLNPDGTRNVEFDPKRNLFSNVPAEQEVAEP